MTYTRAITLLDGAMGTMLQRAGLKLGDRPETLSITAADVVEKIQRQYVQAGCWPTPSAPTRISWPEQDLTWKK